MSGWTHITVEPSDEAQNDTLNEEIVSQINTVALELSQSAGEEQRDALNELARLVEDAQTQIDAQAAHESVETYLRDLAEEFDSTYYQKYPETPTIRWPSRAEDCSGIAKTILDECEAANRVLVVAANDTSDSGTGWLYERHEGSVTKVDTKEGYMGAQAKDVIGYFREEHDIEGRASS